MTDTILKHVATMVDETHSSGKSVVDKNRMAFLIEQYGLIVSRSKIIRVMKMMGLSWTPIQKVKRTYASYCQQSIRNYLIQLDNYAKIYV